MSEAAPGPSSGTAAEYQRRLAARRAEAARLERADATMAYLRLATAIAAAAMAWATWGPGWIGPVWLAAPLVVFLILAARHETVLKAKRRMARAVSYYERGLDRLAGRWAGAGESGERYREESHLYADDLDLFGKGSLFERLCAARTRAGEETLARWLKQGAPAAEIRARQESVRALVPRLDLREDLALLGEEVRAGIHPAELSRWGRGEAVLPAPPLGRGGIHALAVALTAVTGAAIAGWMTGRWGALPVVAAGMLQGGFALWLRPRVLQVLASVDRSAHDLTLFAELLARIEREPADAPGLAALRAALQTAGAPPSAQIGRLRRLVERLDWRRNQFFAPLAYLLMWATHLSTAIEAWRAECGGAIERWLAVAGEFEALASLAGYAWESPGDPFPEILDAAAGPAIYEGRGLGHPLLPEGRCVRNDLTLGDGGGAGGSGGGPRVMIVSGSNMSGKSTLLRTVGVNAVLAMAGAPVRATSLRLSPAALGASLRINDSLQEGTSRFYAEITRLRAIADLAREGRPVLFLIDEMLHGTNSHDRRIGAQGVITGLVARDAVGLVTTHDLALAQIAETLDGRGINVHFEDRLEAGRMAFDYRLRPGVVTHSNALELMRAVGLEV